MLLKLKKGNHLLETRDIERLINPHEATILGRVQWGEEEQDPETLDKNDLCFPSGESLPLCWRDAHYRDDEWRSRLPGRERS